MLQSIDSLALKTMFKVRLEKLGLLFVHDFIRIHNPGRNTYHNTTHMLGVAEMATRLWDIEVGPAEHDEAGNCLEELVVAALFHDFDHSAGELPDKENIADAKLGIEQMLDRKEYDGQVGLYMIMDDGFIPAVHRLMDVTEYPFVHEPVSTSEKIIRDADILYTFQSRTGPIVHGLYRELMKSGRLTIGMTFGQFLEGQQGFLDGVQMFTKTGAVLKEALTAKVIAEQKRFDYEVLNERGQILKNQFRNKR
jgi:hypothetical protein